MSHTLWTIGHSTNPSEKFLALLKAHHIQQLVDVRTIPRSRHNPQFNQEILSTTLSDNGVEYTHRPKLGGLRRPKKDSINTGWRNESFRDYADYMQTEDFWGVLNELIAGSQELRTAIMCAEAVPWRCHRSLIADALVTRDWQVRHIMAESNVDQHQLTSFAVVENGLLRYPDPDAAPRLFP